MLVQLTFCYYPATAESGLRSALETMFSLVLVFTAAEAAIRVRDCRKCGRRIFVVIGCRRIVEFILYEARKRDATSIAVRQRKRLSGCGLWCSFHTTLPARVTVWLFKLKDSLQYAPACLFRFLRLLLPGKVIPSWADTVTYIRDQSIKSRTLSSLQISNIIVPTNLEPVVVNYLRVSSDVSTDKHANIVNR